jgi:hypothetical protein
MSNFFKVALILSIVLFVFVGYPLAKESEQEDYIEQHPQQTSRCFAIGDFNSLMSCLVRPTPRLNNITLFKTVGNHMNMTTGYFGYLFFTCLALFLVLAFILI